MGTMYSGNGTAQYRACLARCLSEHLKMQTHGRRSEIFSRERSLGLARMMALRMVVMIILTLLTPGPDIAVEVVDGNKSLEAVRWAGAGLFLGKN